MKTHFLFAICLACLCRTALAEVAEVPVTGRWEDLAYSSAEVNRLTRDKYAAILSGYAEKHQLDADSQATQRVKAISKTLIKTAIAMKPTAGSWNWEIHTTSDPDADAFCMAGGKLMIGSVFVKRLKLNDGELAMLIAHEVAHAVAEHHRETLAEVLRISGRKATTPDITMEQLDADFSMQLRLANLSALQEAEADQLGMILAHNAGWHARDILSFYRKLASSDSSSLLSGAYPSMAARLSMAKGMVQMFEQMDARQSK